ncbi:hypothetical protein [Nannocystis punicea]|uniref:SnoaL-like domain-containing protein n=1 Tax=Nannocystis punicea TaxID=2995304 RepID=A0ABY7H7Z2_9BACT|nr:hypothetical protein [Nannocystis poenicansa]WAS95383.1 hypothetical protein O0S08_04420 [Nannocystis poenicansa]
MGAALSTSCHYGWADFGDTYYAEPGRKGRRDATYGFGLPGPGWRPLTREGAQVAWYHPQLDAVIALGSQCEGHGDASLEAFTQELAIDFQRWEVASKEVVQLIDREALHTVVRASLKGEVETELELYVVKKDGCLFDLQYMAPPHAFAAGRASFHRVVAGLRFPVTGASS